MMSETLAELVDTRIKELGESLRPLAARSGGLISPGELSIFRKGRRADISEQKIIGLARVLRVDEQRVRKAVETSRTQRPLELPGRLNLLDDDMRQALIAVGDYLLRVQSSSAADTAPLEGRAPGGG